MIFLTSKQATAVSLWLDLEQDDDDDSAALLLVANDEPFIAVKGAPITITINDASAAIDTNGDITPHTPLKPAA